MNNIKSRIYHHFFSRKQHFIIGKGPLEIPISREKFSISAEYKNGEPWFKVEYGVAHIYFADVDNIVEFIEKHKETL